LTTYQAPCLSVLNELVTGGVAIDVADPRAIVQEQVDAYNAHDLERFIACYAPTALILDGQGARIYEGHDEMRAGYGPMMEQNPSMCAEIATRIQVGEWVIDEEIVSGITDEGYPPELHAVTVYQVTGGKIQRVQILM
jgi:hypothetical protein